MMLFEWNWLDVQGYIWTSRSFRFLFLFYSTLRDNNVNINKKNNILHILLSVSSLVLLFSYEYMYYINSPTPNSHPNFTFRSTSIELTEIKVLNHRNWCNKIFFDIVNLYFQYYKGCSNDTYEIDLIFCSLVVYLQYYFFFCRAVIEFLHLFLNNKF